MKKERVIAETGAGQHGVATATAAALLGLELHRLHGRARTCAGSGRTSSACASSAPRWRRSTPAAARSRTRSTRRCATGSTNVRTTHYVLGSVLGPDPFPRMVRDFHRVIGEEAKRQLERRTGRTWPDLAIACVGGGSNAIGLFSAFLDDAARAARRRRGGRARRRAWASTRRASARGRRRRSASCTAPRRWCSRTRDGQVAATHSVSAGLDYPAVGPEHALLRELGRVEYTSRDRRRGGRRLPPPGRDARGSCRRSRARTPSPRRCKRAPQLSRAADHPGQPLRPRRQGPRVGLAFDDASGAGPAESRRSDAGTGREPADDSIEITGAIARASRAAASEQRAAFIPFLTAGDPDLATTGELAVALARGRRRPSRARRAVQRPDRRRAGQPGGRGARARLGHDARRRSSRSCARLRRRRSACRSSSSPTSTRSSPTGSRASRSTPRRRASTACSASTCRPKRRRASTRRRSRQHGHRPDLPARPDLDPERVRARRPRRRAASSTTSRAPASPASAARCRTELARETRALARRLKLPLAVGFGISTPAQVARWRGSPTASWSAARWCSSSRSAAPRRRGAERVATAACRPRGRRRSDAAGRLPARAMSEPADGGLVAHETRGRGPNARPLPAAAARPVDAGAHRADPGRLPRLPRERHAAPGRARADSRGRGAGRWSPVDALHAFYAGSTGEVMRGWMTRELREESIADNVDYVRRIRTRPAAVGLTVPLAFLGFSQGASMAWRAALLAGHGSAAPCRARRRHAARAGQARRPVSGRSLPRPR